MEIYRILVSRYFQIDRVVSIKTPSTAPIYENFAREERNKVVTDDTDLMCLIQCKICKKNRREIRYAS